MSRKAPHNAVRMLTMAAVLLAACTMSYAQGRPPGKGGGGHTEVTSNNLSYPAVMTNFQAAIGGTEGLWEFGTASLGKGFSYGCAIPVDEFPNTSCVANDDPTLALSYEECQVLCGESPVFRIYWQKTTGVTWRADSVEAVADAPRSWEADYVDWGDNLESRSWTTNSIIRVETTPFTTLPGGAGDPPFQRGYQMWHVSGKGTDELWGLRTTVPAAGDPTAVPLPFVYDAQVAIVHTTLARLTMTKIGKDAVACLEDGVDPGFPLEWDTDPASATYLTWVDRSAQPVAVCEVKDTPYTPELNIGGRFVYGYNWNLRRETMCPEFKKGGWWRLTFYTEPTTAGALPVMFSHGDAIVLAPPVLPAAGPVATTLAPDEVLASEGATYTAKVSAAHHLTYIDICVRAR